MRNIITAGLIAMFASACGNTEKNQEAGASNLILPGILDVEILEGSQRPEDCQIKYHFNASEGQDFPVPIDCVIAKMVERDDVQWWVKYRDALGAEGWRMTDGLANGFYFEKPVDEECSQQVLLMSVPYLDAEAIASGDIETGIDPDNAFENLIFMQTETSVCGDERRSKKYKR